MSETLHDALIDEIKDLYDAEKQLTKALPKMAKNTTNEELRAAIESHLAETNAQIDRLERVFELIDEKPRGKHCAGMAGILEEGSSVLEEDFEGAVLDACIIASGQRAEHYEIAAYGTCIAWAEALGLPEVAQLLRQTLAEEKAADEKLSALAEGEINEAATADDRLSQEDEQDEAPARQTSVSASAKSAKTTKSAGPRRRAN